MLATQVLRDEHQGILAMLEVVEAAAYRLQEGKPVPASIFVDAAGFFRNFADGCHHGKEESALFPRLVERGIPSSRGPVGVMLAEHEHGREYVRSISAAAATYAAGDQNVIPALAMAVHRYVQLLRAHIDKENNALFIMADQVLSKADQSELVDAFERIEVTRTGPREHERYHAMIHAYQKLAAEWEPVPA